MALNDRQHMLAKLRRLHRRHQRAVARVAMLEDEKAALFEEARALVPPMTFKAIASVFGITEAAVMQHLTRRKDKAEGVHRPRPRKKVEVGA